MKTRRDADEDSVSESGTKNQSPADPVMDVFLNIVPDLFCVVSADGYFKRLNPAWEALLGYTIEELCSRPFIEFIHPDDVAATLEKVASQLGGMETIAFVNRYRTRKDSYKWLEWRAKTSKDRSELFAVARDVTDRMIAEQSLRESVNRFRQIAENSTDFIWEVDTEGVYTYCSEVVRTILGYGVADVVGHMHFYDFFEPATREEMKTAALLIFGRKESFRNFINKNIHKDGHTVILETNGSPILDKNGELLGYRGTDTDITQRVLFEKALRESEEKYRLLAVNSNDVIWTMNLAGDFTYVSSSIEQLQGFTPEEAIAHGIEGSLTPASAAIARKALSESVHEILSGGSLSNLTLTLEHRHKNGSVLWGEVTVSKMVNDKEELIGFVGISRDITERRKVEQRLIQTMAAIESASDAIGISDQNNRIIYRNKAMAALFEFQTSEELVSMGGWQVLFKDPVAGRKVYENINSGKPWSGEIEMVTRSNRIFPAFVRANPIHDDNGKLIGLLGIITDITERVQAEEKLKNSEEIFRSLAEYSPNMIFIILKNKIHYVNQLCVEKLGYSKEELYAEDFDFKTLASPEHKKLIHKNLNLNVFGKEIEPYEFLMTAKDGRQLYTMVNSKLIQMGNENAILGVIMDISEQRWAEEILKRKANQFEHFSSLMVERELKMVELKREVNQLLEKLGEKPRYNVYSDQNTL